jgi:hypothetical protein
MKVKTAIAYNNECLKCGAVDKEMIYVGCLYFCCTCFNNEFGPARDQDAAYEKWLETHKKRLEEKDAGSGG